MSSTEPLFHITPVRDPIDLAATLELFNTYAISLGIDLSFQSFTTELASMPGKYAPPQGELLLARDHNGKTIGCVGLRPLVEEEGSCEMKRLYVTPEGRGLGLGKALVDSIIREAEGRNYRVMRLDTLSSMVQARKLYGKIGFREIGAYYETPLVDTVFLEKKLVA